MGKKYFCEYCERSFRDTIEVRRKHRRSATHQAAKFAFEIDLLRKYQNKLDPPRLMTILPHEEYRILAEVLAKPSACKFHFDQQQSQQSLCKYGDRCKNSHMLNQSQIVHYKDTFLSKFSSIALYPQNIPAAVAFAPTIPWQSNRQLKKEIYQNLWLEQRFGMDKKSTGLISDLLSRNSTRDYNNHYWHKWSAPMNAEGWCNIRQLTHDLSSAKRFGNVSDAWGNPIAAIVL